MPYVFLTDDAFSLGKHCLKPYSQSGLTPIKRIFNYRLSGVRRVTENAFGILTNRFHVFTTTICLAPNKFMIIILTNFVLHNMLCQLSYESYTPEGYIDMEPEVKILQKGDGEKKILERHFYKLCQRVIHEKLLSMPNISEVHFLIIFGDLARFPDNGKSFKTLENTIFCLAIPFFYYTLGVFKHKKNIQNNNIESFFSIQLSQMNCYNFVGNSNLKVEAAGMQMKTLNFVAQKTDFVAMELTCVQLMLIGLAECCLKNSPEVYILKPFVEG